MASTLIGISVLVALKNPPNTVVQGRVAHIDGRTATLTLENGTYKILSTHEYLADLEFKFYFLRPVTA
jgi:enhancer of mRNA-decapping protein 3